MQCIWNLSQSRVQSDRTRFIRVKAIQAPLRLITNTYRAGTRVPLATTHASRQVDPAKSLERLFKPRSVAIVGASSDSRKLSGRPHQFLTRHHFSGDVYLINPNRRTIGGMECYQRVTDLPTTPDVALIVVPAPIAPNALEECGKAGIKNVVIMSSGFEESARSATRVRRVRETSQRYGINLVGPNSEGLWSVPNHAILTFGSAAARPRIRPGPVTVLSQSGSIGGACVRRLQDLGVGCRYYVSTGNETVLSICDYLDFVIKDGGTRVLVLFVEAIRDAWRLRGLCAEAEKSGMRMVALKAGRSDAGLRATQSHTGKMSTPAEVYTQIFRQVGITEVESLDDLVAAATVFAGARPQNGSNSRRGGVAIVSVSGGSRSLIVDECDRLGVPLAEFAPATRRSLRAILSEHAAADNPIDPTGRVLDDPALLPEMVRILGKDPTTEVVFVQFPNWTWRQIDPYLKSFAAAGITSGKAVVVASLNPERITGRAARLRTHSIFVANDSGHAVRMLSFLTRPRDYTAVSGRPSARAFRQDTAILPWRAGADLLGAAGIPLAPHQLVAGPQEIESKLAFLKAPIVVKAVSGVGHKSDHGLVRLNLRSLDDVQSAASDMWKSLGAGEPLLLQQQIKSGVEVLLGARQDKDWGPILVIGSGGIQAELWNDVAILSLPVTPPTIRKAISRLRLWSLLHGYRGAPPADVNALCDAGSNFSRAYLAEGSHADIEINPLIVLEAGKGVVAVDVTGWSQDGHR